MKTIDKIAWFLFAAFVAAALYFHGHPGIFQFRGPLFGGKILLWLGFLSFLGYSFYCSTQESLFKTIGVMGRLYWGRQIGIDLYLGLGLSLWFIYLHEKSVIVLLLWTLPVLLFANLATLVYFAIHFDQIVAKFMS